METTCLLLMMVGGTYALATVPKTKCDATQITHCSPVPGGTVYIKLINNATGYTLELFKDLPGEELTVLTVNEGEVKIQEEYRNRIQFVIKTGTLKITDVEEDDAGQYTLDVYTPEEILVKTRSFTLQMKERRVYLGISISVPGFLLLVIVVWKLKPWRKSGYEMSN